MDKDQSPSSAQHAHEKESPRKPTTTTTTTTPETKSSPIVSVFRQAYSAGGRIMSKLSLSKRKRARVDMQMQMQKQQQEKEEEEAKNSLGSTMLVQERDIIITEAKEREQDDGPSPTKRRRAHVNVGHGSKQQHDGDESSQDSSSSSSSSIDQHSVSSILTQPINNDEDADDEKEYLSPMQSPSMTANGDSKDKERMQEQELATPKRSGTALALNMMSQGTFAIGNGGGKIATTSNSIGNDRATSASASANASTSANASSAGGRLILTGHGDNVTPKRSGAALKPHPPRDDDSGSSEHGDSGRPLKKNRLQEPSSCESEDEGDDEDEAKGEAEGGSLPDNYSYLERVNANMKRNKQRLVDLGYMEKPPTPHIVIPKDVNNCNHNGNGSVRSIEDGDDDYGPMETTGMIFATRTNGLLNKYQDEASFSRHHDIFEDFPHRKRQISLLQSCLWNPVRQMEIPIELDVCGSILNSYTPPPLFVTGPSGTGKTSVVRRILRDLQQDRERDQQLEALKKNCGGRQVDDNVGDSEKKTRKPIGVAYINCSTIEPYGTGPSSILESTYTQLVSQMAVGGGKRGKRMRKRNIGSKRLQTGSSHSLQSDGLSSCSISFDLETDEDSVACSSLGGDSYSRGEDPDDENMDASVGNGDEEDMIENLAVREKIGFVRDATTKSIQSEKPRLQEDAPRRSSRLGVPSQDPVPWKNQTNPGQPPVKMPSSGLVGILSTPASFGRSIAHFCGASEYNSFQRGCAFLVLDCADKLLSFSHQKQRNNAHTNFLSELLLLPKIMKLNLTIIVITDKLMLENSRISNIEAPTNTLGTIIAAVTPIRCNFEAYQSKNIYRDILATSHLVELATGVNLSTSTTTQQGLILQLYRSLVDIIIQSVESTTHDIREMSRLVRILWPVYLEPLGRITMINNDHSTKSKPDHSSLIDRETLEKLGQYLRPHLRRILPHCLLRPGRAFVSAPPSLEPTHQKLPYLAKFLLLAAYLCQKNKADQDRILYTNQRTGQRRKTSSKNSNNQSESLTHASSQRSQSELRMERMTSFPLERMLSVFSSICNKYAVERNDHIRTHNNSSGDDRDRDGGTSINVSYLGNMSMVNSLSELRQHGHIQEASSSGSRNMADENLAYSRSMTSAKFMCTLSDKEAIVMAKNVNFPLNEYLLDNK